MKNIALVTTLFDYPATHLPCFYNNARKYFDENDIHIIRYFDESRRGLSLAEKLYHYKVIKNIEYYKEHFLGKYE